MAKIQNLSTVQLEVVRAFVSAQQARGEYSLVTTKEINEQLSDKSSEIIKRNLRIIVDQGILERKRKGAYQCGEKFAELPSERLGISEDEFQAILTAHADFREHTDLPTEQLEVVKAFVRIQQERDEYGSVKTKDIIKQLSDKKIRIINRHLATLVEKGILERKGKGNYRCGEGFQHLSPKSLGVSDEVFQTMLTARTELRDQTQLTASQLEVVQAFVSVQQARGEYGLVNIEEIKQRSDKSSKTIDSYLGILVEKGILKRKGLGIYQCGESFGELPFESVAVSEEAFQEMLTAHEDFREQTHLPTEQLEVVQAFVSVQQDRNEYGLVTVKDIEKLSHKLPATINSHLNILVNQGILERKDRGIYQCGEGFQDLSPKSLGVSKEAFQAMLTMHAELREQTYLSSAQLEVVQAFVSVQQARGEYGLVTTKEINEQLSDKSPITINSHLSNLVNQGILERKGLGIYQCGERFAKLPSKSLNVSDEVFQAMLTAHTELRDQTQLTASQLEIVQAFVSAQQARDEYGLVITMDINKQLSDRSPMIISSHLKMLVKKGILERKGLGTYQCGEGFQHLSPKSLGIGEEAFQAMLTAHAELREQTHLSAEQLEVIKAFIRVQQARGEYGLATTKEINEQLSDKSPNAINHQLGKLVEQEILERKGLGTYQCGEGFHDLSSKSLGISEEVFQAMLTAHTELREQTQLTASQLEVIKAFIRVQQVRGEYGLAATKEINEQLSDKSPNAINHQLGKLVEQEILERKGHGLYQCGEGFQDLSPKSLGISEEVFQAMLTAHEAFREQTHLPTEQLEVVQAFVSVQQARDKYGLVKTKGINEQLSDMSPMIISSHLKMLVKKGILERKGKGIYQCGERFQDLSPQSLGISEEAFQAMLTAHTELREQTHLTALQLEVIKAFVSAQQARGEYGLVTPKEIHKQLSDKTPKVIWNQLGKLVDQGILDRKRNGVYQCGEGFQKLSPKSLGLTKEELAAVFMGDRLLKIIDQKKSELETYLSIPVKKLQQTDLAKIQELFTSIVHHHPLALSSQMIKNVFDQLKGTDNQISPRDYIHYLTMTRVSEGLAILQAKSTNQRKGFNWLDEELRHFIEAAGLLNKCLDQFYTQGKQSENINFTKLQTFIENLTKHVKAREVAPTPTRSGEGKELGMDFTKMKRQLYQELLTTQVRLYLFSQEARIQMPAQWEEIANVVEQPSLTRRLVGQSNTDCFLRPSEISVLGQTLSRYYPLDQINTLLRRYQMGREKVATENGLSWIRFTQGMVR